MKRITQKFLAVATTVAIALLSTSAALAGPASGQRAPHEGKEVFVPGVTDFPARPAVFIPGVTDFPARPAYVDPTWTPPSRIERVSVDSFQWADAGIGAGLAASALLLAAGAIALRKRRRLAEAVGA